ncbi:MAG: hypothetical protein COY85_02400 [Candidatus Portnoybacteria bacterium CG_4_10_14_0_8_um_filter_40_50]|uniref:SCP domain-containing protein n=1 Tax=Candidatus Portnoybacteria bacterium CG_4_10_14_0_8_um_filter_40_50 TaxID=1974800 RepID=A0A2M7QQZ6_9BACT|nr:MAG: hypothetical protein COY85_02400 [Candidatus Portnoybacteria bacterium CG_4_10_14_0_8_um_filter_40_50]
MSKIIQKLKSIFVPQEGNRYEPLVLSQKALLGYGLSILILKIVIIAFVIYFPKTDFFAAINAQNLVNLINQERTVKNLSALSVDVKLNEAASLKAQDMIANNYFDHTSPSGISPWYWFGKAGYSFVWAGENLAIHFIDTDAVFEAWMASPGHRDNILNPNFKDIGVAVAAGQIDGRQTTVSVLAFGSPAVAQPKTSPAAKTNSPTQPVPKTETVNETQKVGETKEQTPINAPSAEPKLAGEENIKLTQAPIAQLSLPARVLGTFTINFVELAKNLYLYFSLFLLIALAINILVKIRIQHAPTIILTLILIGISVGMIFV